MRLLDSNTLELHTFYADIPLYAILSHTWTDDEVIFEEIGTSEAEKKLGFQKIKRCCTQAASDGYRFVWIDTCCIDKRSSTELSEAINSMYNWYENAQVCYAYLPDVNGTEGHDRPESDFAKSRWFTRGWTLQELVAPSDIVFFGGKDWLEIGTKASLREAISHITKIDISVLKRSQDVFKASVAQRMSWASRRKTTRVEDMAYCLLGIFKVNMPLLYGEGENAFMRLQLELLAVPNEHTIFAWSMAEDNEVSEAAAPTNSLDQRVQSSSQEALGLLAPSIIHFRSCGDIRQSHEHSPSSHYMTNIGLSITLPTIQVRGRPPNVYLAFLDCYRERDVVSEGGQRRICLFLRHEGNSRFYRLLVGESMLKERHWARLTPMFITRVRSSLGHVVRPASAAISIHKLPSPDHGFSLTKIFCSARNRTINGSIEGMQLMTVPCALKFENSSGEAFAVILGRENDYLWLNVLTNVDDQSWERIVNLGQPNERSWGYQLLPDFTQSLKDRHFTDRLIVTLPSGAFVFVALKKVQVENSIQRRIEISMGKNRSHPTIQSQNDQMPEATALSSCANLGFEVHEATPLLSHIEIVPQVSVHPTHHRQSSLRENGRWMRLTNALHKICVVLACNFVKLLLTFVPLGIVAGIVPCNPIAIFVLNFMALIALAPLLSFVTKELSANLRYALRGLVNATFGNAVGIVVTIIALKNWQIRLIQWVMVGSILSNILLVLGCCFSLSGMLQLEQSLNLTTVSTMVSLMAVALASLILPTALYSVLARSPQDTTSAVLGLSRGIAIVLLVLYYIYLYFQLKSPANFFDLEEGDNQDQETQEGQVLGPVASGALLLLVTVLVSVCAESAASSIDPIVEMLPVTKAFIGFVLLPMVSIAAEPATAIIAAYNNKVDLAIDILIKSSMQITLFVMPLMVLLGWIIDRPMELHSGFLEIVAFFVAVFVVNLLVQRGKINYLGGMICVGTYFMIALTMYFYPRDDFAEVPRKF